jgi:cell division protein FtsQ
VVGLAVAVFFVLLYFAARESSLFAVRSVQVEGVRPPVARRIEAALQPLEGKNLFKVRGDEVARLATALPYVAGATYDRAFPHTLRVRVELEEPVAVLRQGRHAWVVSRRGRVMKRITPRTHTSLPRIWVGQSVDVSLGETVGPGAGSDEVGMLDPLRDAHLGTRVGSVQSVDGQWVYALRGGLELRVGTRTDLPLKLAIAERILSQTVVSGYLDVSVPERPVAGQVSQVSG